MVDANRNRTAPRGVLDGIVVLELSDGIPGAYCGKLLAGLGARVIKIEPPGGEPGDGSSRLPATSRIASGAQRFSISTPRRRAPSSISKRRRARRRFAVSCPART